MTDKKEGKSEKKPKRETQPKKREIQPTDEGAADARLPKKKAKLETSVQDGEAIKVCNFIG
jgi:hypothetical protein